MTVIIMFIGFGCVGCCFLFLFPFLFFLFFPLLLFTIWFSRGIVPIFVGFFFFFFFFLR